MPYLVVVKKQDDREILKEKRMLFHVEMTVNLPPDMVPDRASQLKDTEKSIAQKLQQSGVWRHLWRVAGRYANVSIFDVENVDQLHEILSGLPLFPYMTLEVRALCRHGSSIRMGDE